MRRILSLKESVCECPGALSTSAYGESGIESSGRQGAEVRFAKKPGKIWTVCSNASSERPGNMSIQKVWFMIRSVLARVLLIR